MDQTCRFSIRNTPFGLCRMARKGFVDEAASTRRNRDWLAPPDLPARSIPFACRNSRVFPSREVVAYIGCRMPATQLE